jgi:hypothetical protein
MAGDKRKAPASSNPRAPTRQFAAKAARYSAPIFGGVKRPHHPLSRSRSPSPSASPPPAACYTPGQHDRFLSAISTGGGAASSSKADDSSIVRFNVGGQTFATTLSTMRTANGSLLGKMFEPDSPFGEPRKDDTGAIWLDQDPEAFRWILSYLRHGKSGVVPKDPSQRKTLKLDADFYGLMDVVRLIEMEEDCDVEKGDTIEGLDEKLDETLSVVQGISDAMEDMPTDESLNQALDDRLGEDLKEVLRVVVDLKETCESLEKAIESLQETVEEANQQVATLDGEKKMLLLHLAAQPANIGSLVASLAEPSAPPSALAVLAMLAEDKNLCSRLPWTQLIPLLLNKLAFPESVLQEATAMDWPTCKQGLVMFSCLAKHKMLLQLFTDVQVHQLVEFVRVLYSRYTYCEQAERSLSEDSNGTFGLEERCFGFRIFKELQDDAKWPELAHKEQLKKQVSRYTIASERTLPEKVQDVLDEQTNHSILYQLESEWLRSRALCDD